MNRKVLYITLLFVTFLNHSQAQYIPQKRKITGPDESCLQIYLEMACELTKDCSPLPISKRSQLNGLDKAEFASKSIGLGLAFHSMAGRDLSLRKGSLTYTAFAYGISAVRNIVKDSKKSSRLKKLREAYIILEKSLDIEKFRASRGKVKNPKKYKNRPQHFPFLWKSISEPHKVALKFYQRFGSKRLEYFLPDDFLSSKGIELKDYDFFRALVTRKMIHQLQAQRKLCSWPSIRLGPKVYDDNSKLSVRVPLRKRDSNGRLRDIKMMAATPKGIWTELEHMLSKGTEQLVKDNLSLLVDKAFGDYDGIQRQLEQLKRRPKRLGLPKRRIDAQMSGVDVNYF